MEPLEIGKLGVALEAVDCRRELVNRNVSKPQLVSQVVDVKPLDPLVAVAMRFRAHAGPCWSHH
jgi:hypothetical protein